MNEPSSALPLEGKVALVTGSARRNGLAAAQALAGDGAAIVINTRKSIEAGEAAVASIAERGGQAILIAADLTDEAQVRAMFKTAVDTFGSLDILVNNAADRTRKPFLDVTYDEWQHYAYNVINASFLCSREAIPHMLKAGWGSIINIAGINAFVGTPECEALCVAKGGVIALTKSPVSLHPRISGLTRWRRGVSAVPAHRFSACPHRRDKPCRLENPHLASPSDEKAIWKKWRRPCVGYANRRRDSSPA